MFFLTFSEQLYYIICSDILNYTVFSEKTKWFLNDFTTLLGDSLRIYNFDKVTLSGVVDTSDASERGAESIYFNAPILTRCMIKYDHSIVYMFLIGDR